MTKILVRATNWLGDAVLNTPFIEALHKKESFAEIQLLAKPWVSQIFENNPYISKIIEYKSSTIHKGTIGIYRLIKELRAENFQKCYILPNSFSSALIPYLAGIPERIGYARDGRSFLLTNKLQVSKEILNKHQIYYYLNILDRYYDVSIKPKVYLIEEEKNKALEMLNAFNISKSYKIIGINPGAFFGSAKRWEPENFANVAIRLRKEFNVVFLIFGTESERIIASYIENLIGDSAINFAGKTTVRELMALIGFCDLFLTNDTGPMHIAAALDVPVAAIFGSTNPKTTGPFSDKHIVIQKDVGCNPCLKRECPFDRKCFTSITPDEVVAKIRYLFES